MGLSSPKRFAPTLFLLAAGFAGFGWSGGSLAQVRRCTLPDGTTLYTDRTCAVLGAADRPPPRTAVDMGGVRGTRGGCARNLQDLVYEMTTAIDASDVNRLAGVYDWVGASSSSAAKLMDRLDLVTKRPLVDIVPVTASTPSSGSEPAPDLYPQTTVRRPPVALRVEQTLANGSTPSRTVFGLRRHLGCWWITL